MNQNMQYTFVYYIPLNELLITVTVRINTHLHSNDTWSQRIFILIIPQPCLTFDVVLHQFVCGTNCKTPASQHALRTNLCSKDNFLLISSSSVCMCVGENAYIFRIHYWMIWFLGNVFLILHFYVHK